MNTVRGLSIGQHISFSIYWFPISYLWTAVNAILLPVLVLQVVPESLKATALAVVAGTGLLLAVIVQPVAGAASDVACTPWGRRRPFIVVGSLLNLVFLVILAASPSYAMLFFGYVGLQIASNVAHGPYQGLIPDQVPERERGRASGFMGASQVLGMAAGAYISGQFVQAGQMASAFAAIGLTIVAGMALTVYLVPDRPAPQRPKMTPLEAVKRTFDREIFNYPDFLWLVFSRFFILLGLDSTRDFAQYYLRDVLDMPNAAEATGVLMVFVILAGLVTVVPAGYLSDKIGRKRLVMASAACGVVGAFFFLTSRSFTEVLVYGTLIGVGMGAFRSVDWAFATDLIPKSQGGRYLGISNIATAGASAGSYIIGGPIVDFFNHRVPDQGYTALLVLVIAYLAIGTLALVKVREVVAVDDPVSQAMAEQDARL